MTINTRTAAAIQVRIASAVNLMVGLWLIVANFLPLQRFAVAGPWNHGILGMVIVVIAGLRIARPFRAVGLSWMNAVLGVWLIASPFAFGYADVTPVLWSDLMSGFALLIMGSWSALAAGHSREL